MTVLGPFNLNGGWVSDGDIWNPCSPGGTLYVGLMPYLGGAKTMDGFQDTSSQMPAGTASSRSVLGFFYWQDPAFEGDPAHYADIAIAFVPGKCVTTGSGNDYFSAWTDRTGAIAPGTNSVYTFDVLNSIVMCANSQQGGTANVLKISGYNTNAANLGGSPPKAQIVKVLNNFAFLACDLSAAGNMSRVYYSNVADPETWGATNYLDFRKNDGDIITALEAIGSDLIIFKTNSMGRLSTMSQVISGSPALGPLTEISRTIGCVGPQAVDHLPDGTLVFLSSDGHTYQTDGIIFKDLSHNSPPRSNLSAILPNRGVGSGIYIDPLYYAQLKVDPNYRRLFLMATPGTGTAVPVYCYDFNYDAWQDWSEHFDTTYVPTCMFRVPSRASFNKYGAANKYLYFGTSNGYLISPHQKTGTLQKLGGSDLTTCQYETSIQLGGIAPPGFIPRGLILPVSQPNGTGGTLEVTIGFDGTYKSTAEYSGVLTSANKRYLIPIGNKLTSQTFVHPSTMQIKIKLIGNIALSCTILEPFYITDEVPT